jgi:hypothetical protein
VTVLAIGIESSGGGGGTLNNHQPANATANRLKTEPIKRDKPNHLIVACTFISAE